MPRQGAKGKWNLKMSPDEFYWKQDPFKVRNSPEEWKKCDLINGLIFGGNILDIGCGEGRFTYSYYKYGDIITGIDVSYTAIGRARRYFCDHETKLFFWIHDITKSNLHEDFETIIMSEVLYYITPELWKATSENIKKSLEKDGQFIISVGQYFTEADIRKIFPWCEFDKVFKLPSEKYEYNLIMSGSKK